MTELIYDAGHAGQMGIAFGPPRIDIDGIRNWKESVIEKLSTGLRVLCTKRGVEFIAARAEFDGVNTVRLHDSHQVQHIRFKNAVIATGAEPVALPGVTFAPGSRIMDAAGALELADIPERLLVAGGGYVGLELGSVYAALGSRVTVVEMGERLMSGADPDLTAPLVKRLKSSFQELIFQSKVLSLTENENRVEAVLESPRGKMALEYDRVLLALGRRPKTDGLGLDKAGVKLTDQGFIKVDEQRRTSASHIFAVGDLTGEPQLAHKASYEGKIAAEVIAGKPSGYDATTVPAVVYTNPQLAWCGVTETQAKKEGRSVKIQRFPWSASGRAVSMGLAEGFTKLIVDPATERIIGVGIVGRNAESLIAEGVLAVEMGALVTDLALTIHPHPTLSETEAEAAEIFLGGATHILPR